MFCAPVRSRVDAIDGSYVVLIYFIFTRLTVDQNRLSYFLSIHLFFNRWSTKKGTSAASGVGGGGGGGAGAPVATPFTTGLLCNGWI